MQLKHDIVEASGSVGKQALNVPKSLNGSAGIVLPLAQSERATGGPQGNRHVLWFSICRCCRNTA